VKCATADPGGTQHYQVAIGGSVLSSGTSLLLGHRTRGFFLSGYGVYQPVATKATRRLKTRRGLTPLFHTINTIVAIFLAKVSRAISGRRPLASKAE